MAKGKANPPGTPESSKPSSTAVNPYVALLLGALISFLVTYFGLGRSLGTLEGQLQQLKADLQTTVKSEVSDLKVTLGTVDTKLSTTTQRVDLIAGVLPEMKIRLAREEIARPIETAVVTTRPQQKSDGAKVVYVHVIAGENGKMTSYEVPLDKAPSDQVGYHVLGIGRQKEAFCSTAKEMLEWSKTAHDQQSLPSFVDATGSVFLFQTSADDVNKSFTACGFTPKRESKSFTLGSFKDLVGAIHKNSDELKTAN